MPQEFYRDVFLFILTQIGAIYIDCVLGRSGLYNGI